MRKQYKQPNIKVLLVHLNNMIAGSPGVTGDSDDPLNALIGDDRGWDDEDDNWRRK